MEEGGYTYLLLIIAKNKPQNDKRQTTSHRPQVKTYTKTLIYLLVFIILISLLLIKTSYLLLLCLITTQGNKNRKIEHEKRENGASRNY
jgi:hypothetical protein